MWWVLAAIAAMRQHVNKPLPVVPARQTKRFQANRARTEGHQRQSPRGRLPPHRALVWKERFRPAHGRATGG